MRAECVCWPSGAPPEASKGPDTLGIISRSGGARRRARPWPTPSWFPATCISVKGVKFYFRFVTKKKQAGVVAVGSFYILPNKVYFIEDKLNSDRHLQHDWKETNWCTSLEPRVSKDITGHGGKQYSSHDFICKTKSIRLADHELFFFFIPSCTSGKGTQLK